MSYKASEQFVIEFEKKLMTMDPTSLGSHPGDERNSSRYKDKVFRNLMDVKEDPRFLQNADALYELQLDIEGFTMVYDEASIFKTFRDLVEIMITTEKPSAKDTLLMRESREDVINIFNGLDAYTLEGICIHVFGELFNEASDTTVVRVATCIDHVEQYRQLQHQVVIGEREKRFYSSNAFQF